MSGKYLLLVLALTALPALSAATVRGVVQDPSSAVVPGAEVILSSDAGAEAQTRTTDETGAFSFPGVVPGAYRVTVQRQGFVTAQQSVTVAQADVDLKFTLTLAAQETTVEVDTARSKLANSDPVYQALRNSAIAETCTVENLVLQRDAGAFTLRSGAVSFTTPVRGRHTTAVFLGDGTFHLEPQVSFERFALQMQTQKPAVDEAFRSAVFLFTDGTYDEIGRQCKLGPPANEASQALQAFRRHVRHRTENPRSFMEYLLLGDGVPNLDAELLASVYREKPEPRFAAYIHGDKHADLRFLVDPRGALPGILSPEEVGLVNVDPLGTQDGVWYLTHYREEWAAGKARSGEDKRSIALNHYKIETTLGRKDRLASVTEVRFQALRNGDRVVPFKLLPNLRVSRVALAGKEIAFIQEPRRSDAGFYVVLPEPTQAGTFYTLTMEYEGNKVVRDEGGGSYSVDARDSWYPSAGLSNDRATYDLTFHVPKGMTLVSIGKQTKAYREQDDEVTQWSEDWPVAVAGFNYGFYKGKQALDAATQINVEAWATRDVPDFLRQFARNSAMSPSAMAENAMIDGQNSLRIFTRWFGPLPFARVALTQQPQFNFGQSWPTLVYLPVSAFLDATERWRLLGRNTFKFSEFIEEVTPHEVAHQWWGHMVGWASYHDQWLSEGFADFSASLFLQNGAASKQDKFLKYWEHARKTITEKNQFGFRATDAGPIWMGLRLNSYRTAGAYNRLIYPKGGFVLHMLRMLMYDAQTGDQNFVAMMQDFTKTFSGRSASTEDFMAIAEKHITPAMDLAHTGKLDWFFSEWVYGREVPSYGLQYSFAPADGGKLLFTGKVTQSDVSNNFAMRVPIYADFGGGPVKILSPVVVGNQTSREMKVILPKRPKKIMLNAYFDVLSSKDTAEEK